MQLGGEVEELYFGAACARGPRSVCFYAPRQPEPLAVDYLALLERARGAAAALGERLSPGEPYLLLAENDLDTVVAFLGGLLCGALPAPLSPPLGLGGLEAWNERVRALAADLSCRVVVGRPEHLALLEGPLGRVPCDAFPLSAPPSPLSAAGLSHVQLTSGSTGRSKGVRIAHRNLAANLFHIGWASDVTDADRVVSWLPLYHDMGLVGVLLFSLYWNLDLVLLSPVDFLARPVRWLEAIHRHRGSLSPAPSFAYPYVAHRLRGRTPSVDLSSWRIAYCGAEPIQREAVQRFVDALAPCGLSPGTILPCYGLAEATLAVTFAPWGRGLRAAAVSRQALGEGTVAPALGPEDGQELVLLGAPLPEIELELRDAEGRPADAGRTGEVWLRGPTVTPGYLGEGPEADAAGWLRTGDLGCWVEEELALIGRCKDLLIVRGRNHAPVTLEWAAEGVEGVRPGSAAAFSCYDAASGTEAPIVACEVAENESDWSRGAIGRQVEEAVLRRTHLRPREVLLLDPGAIPKTTSGKIQRSRVRELYLSGRLGGEQR